MAPNGLSFPPSITVRRIGPYRTMDQMGERHASGPVRSCIPHERGAILMTLFPLMECCHQLAIDPKTLRHWLQQSAMSLHVHPLDGRRKCLTHEQVHHLAALHHRLLLPDAEEASLAAPLVETPPREAQPEPAHPYPMSTAGQGSLLCSSTMNRCTRGCPNWRHRFSHNSIS